MRTANVPGAILSIYHRSREIAGYEITGHGETPLTKGVFNPWRAEMTDTYPVPRPKIAETVIHPSVQLRDARIGTCCEILDDTSLHTVELGDFSYLGQRCIVENAVIGRFCAVAAEVRIGAPNHPMSRPSMHRFTYCPEYYSHDADRDLTFFTRRAADCVIIGHDVWIGHGVIVLPGVKIGNGAVLAAGAVVSKDVAPYTVVGGVPAKLIRKRFEPVIVSKLTDIAWWDWPFATIIERLPDFQSENINAFCDRWWGKNANENGNSQS